MKTKEHNQTADVEPESTRHTPGPWKDNVNEDTGLNDDGNIVAVNPFVPITGEVYGRTKAEAHANARLIAAAPDLLEACKEARMTLTLDYHGATKPKKALCDISAAASQAHNALVLAIQKAEAGQ